MSRVSRPWSDLDRALEQLRAHGLPYRWDEKDLRVWHSICPACRCPEWGLRLREGWRGGPVSLICAAGCEDVREALDREPLEPRVQEALELAERARDIAARALARAAA